MIGNLRILQVMAGDGLFYVDSEIAGDLILHSL